MFPGFLSDELHCRNSCNIKWLDLNKMKKGILSLKKGILSFKGGKKNVIQDFLCSLNLTEIHRGQLHSDSQRRLDKETSRQQI